MTDLLLLSRAGSLGGAGEGAEDEEEEAGEEEEEAGEEEEETSSSAKTAACSAAIPPIEFVIRKAGPPPQGPSMKARSWRAQASIE